ncbi:hypothetical protein [Flavobacterium granuli]|uniref:Uncharacterized protein n=1 Tax=Flavobacterium granuli TaxID=280093 RepID=A0ABU1S0B3_9FLAO|nr:hypothetical protein [Flavobacterium granuli]MDR6844478.1 hypothetical protein [Flavobacterium granuli]
MSKITKQIAELTAKKLVKPKKEKIDIQKKELKEEVEKLLLKQIPTDVLTFYKKYPNYTDTSASVEISGNGWNFQRVLLNKELPSPNKNKHQLLPDVENASILLKLFNEIKDAEKSVEKLEADLSITIFALRTYKSVEENFPEAFDLLPKIVNNSLQINLSDIRNRVNN